MTAEYWTTFKCILFSTYLCFVWVSLVAQMIKIPPAIQETWVWSLGLEDPLEKEMATHSSILAWRIPWTEQPGRLQSMRSQSWTQLSDLILSFALYSVCASSLLESILFGGYGKGQIVARIIRSDQISRSVVSDSLWPRESQHTRLPCPSPTPGVHSDSRPSSQWCHPAISSSVVPFSSCPQSLPSQSWSSI